MKNKYQKEKYKRQRKERLYKKRVLHWKLFHESMVDRAMKLFDQYEGKIGCHKKIAKEIQINNNQAYTLIYIGKRRRK